MLSSSKVPAHVMHVTMALVGRTAVLAIERGVGMLLAGSGQRCDLP